VSPLERALVDAVDTPSSETRATFLQHLAGSALYLGLREPASLDVDGNGALRSAADVTVLAGSGPHGLVLFGFTSQDEMRTRNTDAHALLLPLRTIRDLIGQQNHDGLVINPGTKWVFISSAELDGILPGA
jgi:hypothetical protein